MSNTLNQGKFSFKFGDNPITNTSELNPSKMNKKTNEETKEEKKEETKSQSISLEESKSTPTEGVKLANFKFNQESFSTPLAKNTFEFSFNDKKSSPSSKLPEIKFNAAPTFNFPTTVPSFSFGKPTEQNDTKPFFSFGSKLPTATPNADPIKSTEDQKSKDEEDEDQPPVVNFTPIKESDAIFESKSKLFCLKNGKYEEHGIGQLYLKPVGDKKIQLLMRNDSALGTIMVNTLLNETVNFTKRNAKNVQLICILDPTKSTKPQTVLFKFKDSQITDSFESELNKLKN